MVVMHDLAHRVEHVGLQVLHVVQLGELAAVVGGDVLVELVERLLAQVVAVHQEQHALRPGELDQAVDEGDRGEGLAAAGRHLDQRAGPVLGEATAPGSGSPRSAASHRPSVISGGICRRRARSVSAPRRPTRPASRAGGRRTPGGCAARGRARRRRRSRRRCSRRQRAAGSCTWGMFGRQARQVGRRLLGHAAQGRALRLGLDHADGLAVDEEQVVGKAGLRGNSRTATPRAAPRLSPLRSWTCQPAASSSWSIVSRACSSGVGMGAPTRSAIRTTECGYKASSATKFPRTCAPGASQEERRSLGARLAIKGRGGLPSPR